MHAIFALAIMVLLVAGSTDAQAQKRVALVIGNGHYDKVGRLANPTRDAGALEAVLRTSGFDVVEGRRDLSRDAMRRALRDFSDSVRDADIAVVFFAGHGIEVNGTNYMIPVDANLERDIDVEDEAVPLDRVLQILEPAKRLRLVILDACRDNPFARSIKRSASSRSIGRGLAKVEVLSTDTLVAFAAKAGSIALDGDGANSPYTNALVKHLTTPGLDLRLALGRVRDEVLKNTNHKQEPFVYGSLGGAEIALVSAVPYVPSLEPIKQPTAGLFDGIWRVTFTWNERCTQKAPNNVATWTIANSVLAGPRAGAGAVSATGAVRAAWPNPFLPAVKQTMSAQLVGDRGQGTWLANAGGCGGTVSWTRLP